SYLSETRRVASEFLKRNLQLIVFAQSRLTTEILTTYLKDDFEGIPGAPERIRGYRGGYLPNRRRELEKGFGDGIRRAAGAPTARALIDPDNLHILVDHVKCAAFELPFTASEEFGKHDVQEILGVLSEQGLVHLGDEPSGGAAPRVWNWTNESYPADAVSLR